MPAKTRRRRNLPIAGITDLNQTWEKVRYVAFVTGVPINILAGQIFEQAVDVWADMHSPGGQWEPREPLECCSRVPSD